MRARLSVCAQPGCGELITRGDTRCKEHRRFSPTYEARNRSWAERERRREAVQTYVSLFGWVCPGWQREPHPSTDLTAAHVVAAAHGGASGPITILCRSCNSRQGVQ